VAWEGTCLAQGLLGCRSRITDFYNAPMDTESGKRKTQYTIINELNIRK
jgi:hypothetical protein